MTDTKQRLLNAGPATANGIPAATAQAPGQSAATQQGGSALYIGNLAWWTTDAELEAQCAEFGEVSQLTTYEDKTNGKSKGYVMVEFASPAAATACRQKLSGYVWHYCFVLLTSLVRHLWVDVNIMSVQCRGHVHTCWRPLQAAVVQASKSLVSPCCHSDGQ